MKKILLILLVLFMLTGCSANKKIETENLKTLLNENIQYLKSKIDEITINESEYQIVPSQYPYTFSEHTYVDESSIISIEKTDDDYDYLFATKSSLTMLYDTIKDFENIVSDDPITIIDEETHNSVFQVYIEEEKLYIQYCEYIDNSSDDFISTNIKCFVYYGAINDDILEFNYDEMNIYKRNDKTNRVDKSFYYKEDSRLYKEYISDSRYETFDLYYQTGNFYEYLGTYNDTDYTEKIRVKNSFNNFGMNLKNGGVNNVTYYLDDDTRGIREDFLFGKITINYRIDEVTGFTKAVGTGRTPMLFNEDEFVGGPEEIFTLEMVQYQNGSYSGDFVLEIPITSLCEEFFDLSEFNLEYSKNQYSDLEQARTDFLENGEQVYGNVRPYLSLESYIELRRSNILRLYNGEIIEEYLNNIN